jgi:hypothetical protein
MTPRKGYALSLCLAAAGLSAVAAGLPQTTGQAQLSERARLLGLQREATAALTLAARPDASADEVRRGILEAIRLFEALGGESAPGATPDTPQVSFLAPALRDELRKAASFLTILGVDPPPPRLNAAPFLALLERARVQLEGEIALGLSFQGSYSQTPAKDPVTGAAGANQRYRFVALARHVRGGRAAARTHLLRRPDERSRPRIGW